jgi:4-amino-4-deoxy-L-arabinose transferase-like glycosyltransferase
VIGWRPFALLALLCLALYLPGMTSLPPVDRDESRYVQATRQMLESGDFLRIRFQEEARNKKPAGIYWLQAASVAALSDAESTRIWPYRLPSLIGALAAVLLTFAFGRRIVGDTPALLGAALLGASLNLVVEAHFATTDAVLLATVVAAQGALAIVYLGRGGWLWPLIFWLAQGAGILVKGPVAPLVSALTVLALAIADRDARWLRRLKPLPGALLLLLIVGPWLIAITFATRGAFLGEAVGHDFLGKLIGAQESHGLPPGSYLALLPAGFWPGSLFLGAALLHGWRQRRAPPARFLIAWAVPFWLVLELVPTKLPHYLLPAYPALALMAGSALAAQTRQRWFDAVAGVLWAVVGIVLAIALFRAPVELGRGESLAGIACAAILLAFGGRLLVSAWREPGVGTGARAALLAVLVLAPALAFVAPTLDRLWLSRAAAAMVERHAPPKGAPVLCVGYGEPSLVFLLGTATRIVPAEAAARQMAGTQGMLALVESRQDDAFRKALAARGRAPRDLDQVAGLDYSNGRRMTLTLYAAAPR